MASTSRPQAQQDEQQQANFFARHRYAFMFLGLLLFTAAVAVSIYFTAGTTLPFMIGLGAKVGINLGFLATMSPPAAIAASTGIVAGFTLAATATIALFAKCIKSIIKCCKSTKDKEPNPEPTNEGSEQDLGESSTAKMNQAIGGPKPGATVGEVAAVEEVKVKPSTNRAKAPEQPNIYPAVEELTTDDAVVPGM